MSVRGNNNTQLFLGTFNAIDKYLREELSMKDKEIAFSRVVREYAKRHRNWTSGEALLHFTSLRNFLVHESTVRGHLADPTEETMLQIARIHSELISPETAFDRFKKDVESLRSSQTLKEVLCIINEREYSQFPVFANGEFAGLLTENGITRWLARHVSSYLSIVDFEDAIVKDIADSEERADNCLFVSRTLPVRDLRQIFSENAALEAALITHSGKSKEGLLGIATRWDLS